MQFLIETDILLEYLHHSGSEPSILRHSMAKGVCYTTMLNAFEVFRIAKTKEEEQVVLNMLTVVRVLGFNARYAQTFAEVARQARTELTDRDAIILGMAQASKLVIITDTLYEQYSRAEIVNVMRSPDEVPHT